MSVCVVMVEKKERKKDRKRSQQRNEKKTRKFTYICIEQNGIKRETNINAKLIYHKMSSTVCEPERGGRGGKRFRPVLPTLFTRRVEYKDLGAEGEAMGEAWSSAG